MEIKSDFKQNIFEKTAQNATFFLETTMAFIIAASISVTWLLTVPLIYFEILGNL